MEVTVMTPEFGRWMGYAMELVRKERQVDLTFKDGPRYIKIVEHIGAQRGVFAFIDKKTGNVLKPESWSKPARHARGNIFDADGGTKYLTPYGPQYLR